MPDKEGMKDSHEYHLDVPAVSEPFKLKGSNSLDWGMKNRLSKIFNPESGRTVMLAFDHGYFMGPTSGLEQLDHGHTSSVVFWASNGWLGVQPGSTLFLIYINILLFKDI